MGILDWSAVPNLGSRQVCAMPLKAPGHSGQDLHWLSHNVHPQQAAEQEAYDWGLPAGTSSSSLAVRRCTSQRSGNLLSLMRMNLKTWWQKICSSEMALGSCTSLIVVPWQMAGLCTNGRPCTYEIISTSPSLTMLTNKSYFLLKKKFNYSINWKNHSNNI